MEVRSYEGEGERFNSIEAMKMSTRSRTCPGGRSVISKKK